MQASRKPHKAQRDRKLMGWCASTRVPVVHEPRGRSAGWRPAPWPLAYPHLNLDGLTAVLLHRWSRHEGRRWGGITARNPSRHSLLPGLLGISVDYKGWAESCVGLPVSRCFRSLQAALPRSRTRRVSQSSLQSDTCVLRVRVHVRARAPHPLPDCE